ncbi:MAG: hypothetical protein O9289_19605, partial [Rhodobacteraceae bacterium]|nr:hypothetical protein [Paracoccaceae bacterium]
PALRQHDLRFTQLADDLFRLVLPRHSIPPSWQNLKQILGHSEGGRSSSLKLGFPIIASCPQN